jgi:peptide/nickel transport system permease protein
MKEWRKALRKFARDRLAVLGAVLTILLLSAAVIGPFITPYGYNEQNLSDALKPPFWDQGGSLAHPFGTDQLGRDLLSRILYGARISLAVGASAVLLAGTVGTIVGVICGFYGGFIDTLLMRLADTQLSFPALFLSITVMAVLGQGVENLILVLGMVTWVGYARVARASTLSIKEREYVTAARCQGATPWRIITHHILPNVLPAIIAIATINVSGMILSEAGLSFLGLGVRPPLPTWGRMLSDGRQVFIIAPWNAFLPGLAITITVFAINLLGDGLAKER